MKMEENRIELDIRILMKNFIDNKLCVWREKNG